MQKIKNHQRTVLYRWLFTVILFTILGISSYINFDINSFDGMIILVSLTIVPTSLFFIKSTIKDVKILDQAINNKKNIVHWKYTKKEWQNYLKYETEFRTETGKIIAIPLSIMTAIIFIPFILIISEGKLFMFIVMLLLFSMYAFMGLVLPKIIYYFRKKQKGEIILMEKAVLINKEFHTWDFLLSKFGSASFVEKPYNHIELTYKFVDRTGPRNYTLNIPIPKNNKKDIKEIISKFK